MVSTNPTPDIILLYVQSKHTAYHTPFVSPPTQTPNYIHTNVGLICVCRDKDLVIDKSMVPYGTIILYLHTSIYLGVSTLNTTTHHGNNIIREQKRNRCVCCCMYNCDGNCTIFLTCCKLRCEIPARSPQTFTMVQ